MMVLRVSVSVAGFVGGTVLDDLAVRADMDMRVRKNRRHAFSVSASQAR